jgi:murein DD-endopeptidase MepM/ murein hydrolase activator NlpD
MTDQGPIRRRTIWNIKPKEAALRAGALVVIIAAICVGLMLMRPRARRPEVFGVGARYVPSILPVSLETGGVSSEFGLRTNPETGKEEGHKGIDLAVDEGVPVKAAADGKVIFAGDGGTYGKLVKIDHGNRIETRYAHNSVLKVKAGGFVKRGQVVALAGHTGRVRGNPGDHLHYEVRIEGKPVNPRTYLPKNLPRFGETTQPPAD